MDYSLTKTIQATEVFVFRHDRRYQRTVYHSHGLCERIVLGEA